jgi:hypothetical protein
MGIYNLGVSVNVNYPWEACPQCRTAGTLLAGVRY